MTDADQAAERLRGWVERDVSPMPLDVDITTVLAERDRLLAVLIEQGNELERTREAHRETIERQMERYYRAADARDALAATVDRVRALHTPHYEIDGVQHDYVVMLDCFDLPKEHVCRTGEDACRPDMEEHYALACGECRQNTVDAEPGALLWPCPTIRALDGDTAEEASDRG